MESSVKSCILMSSVDKICIKSVRELYVDLILSIKAKVVEGKHGRNVQYILGEIKVHSMEEKTMRSSRLI